MTTSRSPDQTQVAFTRRMGLGGAATGAIGGFFAGGFEGVTQNLGERADIGLAIVGGVAGAIIMYFASKAANRRANELKRWCASHGWTWIGNRSPWGRDRTVAELEPTVTKSKVFWHGAVWQDVLVRDEGGTPAIFAIREVHREHQTSQCASFLIVRHSGTCPDTTIEPGHSKDLLPKMDGRHKVEFESAGFNRHWRVFSRDPKAAYAHLDQATIDFLEKETLKPAFEFVGDLLIIRFDGNAHEDGQREHCLRWSEAFSRIVPDDLLEPLRLMNEEESAPAN